MPRTRKPTNPPAGAQPTSEAAQCATGPASGHGQPGNSTAAKRPGRQPRKQLSKPPAPALPPAAEVETGLRQFREDLAGALPLLKAIPREVGELRGWLRETGHIVLEVVRQLRETDQDTRTARAHLDQLRHEYGTAEQRLAAIRAQTSEVEARLAALRQEARTAEERVTTLHREATDARGSLQALRNELEEARAWLEERRHQPAPPAPTTAPATEGHNRLGATVDPGVVVAEVVPDTPADLAGLEPGDVIVSVGGTMIFSGEELLHRVQATAAGDELRLRVERAGAFEEVKVRLGPLGTGAGPLAEGHNRLGVTVEPGVVVAEVVPGSSAAHAGLVPGDVIQSADGTPVVSGPQFRDLIQRASAGSEVTLQVDRGDALFVVKVQLESAP